MELSEQHPSNQALSICVVLRYVSWVEIPQVILICSWNWEPLAYINYNSPLEMELTSKLHVLSGVWKLILVSNRMHLNTKKNLNTLKNKTIDQIKCKIVKSYQV